MDLNKNPLVSILIPTYNRASFILRTVRSALKQDYQNIELIISDNCSTDGSVKILNDQYAEDVRIRMVYQLSNIGAYKNWETCISNANGEYSKILWSDDELSTNTISSSLDLFDDSIGLVYSPAVIKGPTSEVTCYKRLSNNSKISSNCFLKYEMLGLNVPYSPGAVLVRTSDLVDAIKYINDIGDEHTENLIKSAIGPDLLIILYISSKYDYVGYNAQTCVTFNATHDSITVNSNINTVNEFYDLSKICFVKNKPSLHKYLWAAILLNAMDSFLRSRATYKPFYSAINQLDRFSIIYSIVYIPIVAYRIYMQPRLLRLFPFLKKFAI